MAAQAGKLFIVSAPSGAGKSTLVNELIAQEGHLLNIYRAVTYTTRAPRRGEIPDIDYHYISSQEFMDKKAKGHFLEVTDALGTYYGTPRSILDERGQGKSPILVIDRPGAQSMLLHCPDAICIWIEVPSFEILERRLRSRGTDTEDQIAHRLFRAQYEILMAQGDKLYTYHVMNDDFVQALKTLSGIVKKELGVLDEGISG